LTSNEKCIKKRTQINMKMFAQTTRHLHFSRMLFSLSLITFSLSQSPGKREANLLILLIALVFYEVFHSLLNKLS
jgi:hypothetical protein